MSDIAIRCEGLGKQYRIGQRERYHALRDTITETIAAPFRWLSNPRASQHNSQVGTFWALKDLSFDIKQGEVVGVIGRNGAGKSTLLKILSRITAPTEGEVKIFGRVASLLEVGTGFHPELTGRENIYLNGAILGMKGAEIKRKFDEIVSFAEVEKFIDTPVKRYSSGMYVRLAFAVAAHLDPEILLIDEVLAVGDAQFQSKCLGKINAVAREGRTVLFVSHNMGAISSLTQQCLYLERGKAILKGPSHLVVARYLTDSIEQAGNMQSLELFRREQTTDSPVRIIGIGSNGSQIEGAKLPTVQLGSSLIINLELDVARTINGAHITIALKTIRGECAALLVSWDKDYVLDLDPGVHTVRVEIRNLPLAPGDYFVDAGIGSSVEAQAHDMILDLPTFSVVNNGQVTQWLDRPWGVLHCDSAIWDTVKQYHGA